MSGLHRTIAAALAAALLGLTAPSASADDGGSVPYEGCGFETLALEGDTYSGVVYAVVVPYSRTHGNVVTATVTCSIRINGVDMASVTGSGAGVVAFAGPAEFVFRDTDDIRLCTTVDVTSDWTPTATWCRGTTNLQAPPQEWIDLLDAAFGLVGAVVSEYADPLLCPALGRLAPGAEPVTFTPEGDVFVEGELSYDCPPYDHYPPPDPDAATLPLGIPTGSGWNDGDSGFLALTSGEGAPVSLTAPALPDPELVVAACGFRRAAGSATVSGGAVALSERTVPDEASVRCTLVDAVTGETVYDATRTGGATAWLTDTVATTAEALTVCTEGTGRWGARVVTTGRHCRPGRPV